MVIGFFEITKRVIKSYRYFQIRKLPLTLYSSPLKNPEKMTEQLFLKQINQLPDNLKQELFDFLEFLLQKYQNKQTAKPQKPEKTDLTELQRLLLDAPDMPDETYQLIMEKRKALNQWN